MIQPALPQSPVTDRVIPKQTAANTPQRPYPRRTHRRHPWLDTAHRYLLTTSTTGPHLKQGFRLTRQQISRRCRTILVQTCRGEIGQLRRLLLLPKAPRHRAFGIFALKAAVQQLPPLT